MTEITGHLIERGNNLGRSLIIDLNADKKSNFRQVDHRTIQYIIFKNVKYTLGKKAPGTEELPLKADHKNKWESSKLQIGNWFSSSQYFKIKTVTDKDNCQVIKPENPSKELTMSRDILVHEMNSGKLFDKTEKLTRSEIVDLMINARECAFTVVFYKLIDDAYVTDALANAGAKIFSDAAKMKELSKQLTHGKEVEMTCF